MKVSAENIPHGKDYQVTLNGEKVQYAVEADDVEGYVIYIKPNDNYNYSTDGMNRHKVFGEVTIIEIEAF